eukprot:scaffold18959_cov67-Cyclotella_meneghiniana.AAC.3
MIVSFSQILPNPAVVGALSVKLDDQNIKGFDPIWFTLPGCNQRNLSISRLRCESSESNLLHQCCTNRQIFRGESPWVSLVGVTHSKDPDGKEIVSLLDGLVHPHLKVLPLSTDMLKEAIKKCNNLGNENTAKESINLDGYDDKTLAKNLFDTLNEVYPNFNDTTQLENFVKRLDTLINDADEDWRTKSACLPYPKPRSKNLSVDTSRLRSFIQFNLSVALRICFITLDGIHRGMSFEICVLGSRYLENIIAKGTFANSLKKEVDDFAKNVQSDKYVVTIHIPTSLDGDETSLMRTISRDKQEVNDLAHRITVMDEVSNFLTNDPTKFNPPREITEETLKKWSYENYKRVKDFIEQHGETFGVQRIT